MPLKEPVTQVPVVRRRAIWWVPAALFFGCCVVFGLTAQTSSKVSVDVYASSLAGWRIAATGNPWLDDLDTTDIDVYGQLPDETVFIREAANGHRVSHRLAGPIAAAVPAYWLRGAGDDPASYSLGPEALTAAVAMAAAMTLFFLAVRRRMGQVDALAATLVLGFATPIWSVAANALWPHTVSAVGICGMAWAASRNRWWLVGFFGGVALWGRLHAAVIVAVLAVGVALVRRQPGIALKAGTTSAAALGLVVVWTHWVFGTWNPGGGGYSISPAGAVGGTRYDPTPDPVLNQLGLWVSPDRGILIWTPVLLLLLPAVVRSWRTIPDWSRWLAIGGLAYTLIQGQLNFFDGGGAHYGYRLGLEFLVSVAPAVAFSAAGMGSIARRLIGPVIGLQFAAIALGAVFDGPAPAESYGWSDNAFLYALRLAPVVAVIPIGFIVLGHFAGRSWARRRKPLTTESTVAGE